MRTDKRVRHGPIWLTGIIAMVVLVLATGMQQPPAANAEDECVPDGDVACLPLPVEEPDEAAPGSAPSGAAAAPRPCPPIFVPDPASIAAPILAPRGCGARDIVAAVNHANVVYTQALRSLDARVLAGSWTGEALAELQAQIATLRSSGRYATPRLLSITLRDIKLSLGFATVRTAEHWIYQERSQLRGSVEVEYDQWVENIYSMRLQGGTWVVERDVITVIAPPAPPPVPNASASVTSDRDTYQAGERISGIVINTGNVQLTAAGGYICGLLDLEWFGPDGWQRAPLPQPDIYCTLIAHILHPGESRRETFPAVPQPGIYRLTFSFSAERLEGVRTAYSAPFVVR
jgi:hypothetical protein